FAPAKQEKPKRRSKAPPHSTPKPKQHKPNAQQLDLLCTPVNPRRKTEWSPRSGTRGGHAGGATPGLSLLGGLPRRGVLHRLLQVLLEGPPFLVELGHGGLLLLQVAFEAAPLLGAERGIEQPLFQRRQPHLGVHLLLDLDGVVSRPVLELG